MSEATPPSFQRPALSPARAALRLWLARGLKLMAWAMLLGFLYWCIAGLGSDEQTQVPRYDVDISALAPGQAMAFSVGNQPLIVLHRSAAQLAALDDTHLNDAGSWQNQDPSGLDARHRGVRAAWLVVEALGTELNCPVQVSTAGGEFQGRPWPGGFADRCRDQRYDWAGRVFAGQGATRNLRALRYQLVSGARLSIELQ